MMNYGMKTEGNHFQQPFTWGTTWLQESSESQSIIEVCVAACSYHQVRQKLFTVIILSIITIYNYFVTAVKASKYASDSD